MSTASSTDVKKMPKASPNTSNIKNNIGGNVENQRGVSIIGENKGDITVTNIEHQHVTASIARRTYFRLQARFGFGINPTWENFVGRQQQFQEIGEGFKEGKIVVISGLGGIGKTELAKKYADDSHDQYGHNEVLLNAESNASLEGSVKSLYEIGKENGNTERKDATQLLQEIYVQLNDCKTLFIFDNAVSFTSVQNYFPNRNACLQNINIIVTSNQSNWPSSRFPIHNLHLTELREVEALQMVKEKLKIPNAEEDEQILELAKMLNYLPLALVHASAYIGVMMEESATTPYSVGDFVKKFQKNPKPYIRRNYTDENLKTIQKTMEISIEKLTSSDDSELALKILDAMSFLSPDNINLALFEVEKNDEELKCATNLLKKFSIVTDLGSEHVKVHRLVQIVRRQQLSESEERKTLMFVLDALERSSYLPLNYNFHESHLIKDHLIIAWGFAYKYKEAVEKYLCAESDKRREWFELILDGEKVDHLKTIIRWISLKDFNSYIPAMRIKNMNMKIIQILYSKYEQTEKRAKINQQLPEASELGLLDVVTFLLRNHSVNVNATDCGGRTALLLAASKGHIAIVKYLLEDEHADTSVTANNGKTPLHLAGEKGHLDVVKYLIEEGHADTSVTTTYGHTPLHLAAREGRLKVVKYLIEEGHTDTSVTDTDGKIPLHLAAWAGHLEVVKYLIEEGHVDTSVTTTYGHTPLHLAACEGHLKVVKYLIEEGHVDTSVTTNYGHTPLHLVACVGHMKVVKYLIEEGHADTSVTTTYGKTPLHLAAREGRLKVVKYLIEECHADTSVTDTDGKTPLHLAAWAGHLEVVKDLIEEGHADTSVTDTGGKTPLHLAAEMEHWEVVKYLI